MKKEEQEQSQTEQNTRGNRREQEGIVVSNKMEKSIVVAVQMYKKHPQYGKYVRNTMKFMAHDENGECNIGDKVVIKESRPLSKNKRWRLHKVVERAA
jgi:small subunit ribosomal protein S17